MPGRCDVPRSDYLQKSGSVQLDASGNGTVTLKPDVGQYWTPRFVRVSTLSQGAPLPYCAVYHGAVTIKNQTTFIDDTYMGNGDTSSIIAGTVVQFGEAITAVWSGGNGGDTAVLTVYGSSQDTPPSVSDMPSTPGTHFSGKQTELAIHVDGNGLTLNAAGEVKGPVIDVRPWSSYYLTVFAERTAGAATAYNPVTIRMVWFSDANGSIPIYADVYEIFALRTAAPFLTRGGKLFGQDALHGPFMQVIINNLGPDSLNVNYELLGTTRTLPGPYMREMSAGLPPDTRNPDNFIVNPEDGVTGIIAPGADFFIPGWMRYGKAHWRVSTSQAFTLAFFAGSTTPEFYGQTFGPGTFEGDIEVPKRSTLVRIHNSAGVNMTAFFNMISENVKF